MLANFKRKGLLYGLAAVLVLGGGGFAYFTNRAAESSAGTESSLQTAIVRRGDLILLASGSGTVIPAAEVELGFGASGPIAELHVQVGDRAQEGQVLAIQGDREQLEAAVASDQVAVMNAQRALDDLYQNAGLVTAQAAFNLANTQDELEDAERTWQYQQEGYRASSTTIEAAEAELVIAQDQLARAKAKYDSYSGLSSDDPQRAQAYKTYAAAIQSYERALANLNWYTGHPTELQQAILDAEVALARAQYEEAKVEYEKVKDGPDADEIALAELQLVNAQAKLAVSERALTESILLAPMDGTVTAVDAQVGDTLSGPFITMADLSRPQLEIFLDETDLDKIDLDFEVEVVFDALPDLTFTGRVVQVDPTLFSSQGVSAIRAIVQLDDRSGFDFQTLPIGLNAAVDVIGGRAEGVALVPVEALRELGPGEYAVFVIENGEPVLRIVDVGIMDFTYAEIVNGLEPGEIVSTGIVETDG